jgi:hypothetical protein
MIDFVITHSEEIRDISLTVGVVVLYLMFRKLKKRII